MKNKKHLIFISSFIILSCVVSLINPAFTAKDSEDEILSYKLVSTDGQYGEDNWVDDDGNKVIFDDGGIEKSVKKSASTQAVIPEKYDSRNYGYISEVKDQGISGSCWSFSAVAAAEASLASKGIVSAASEKDNLSEAHLVWFTHQSLCDKEYDGTYGDGTRLGNPYALGGNWMRTTFALSRGSGFALESDYPFDLKNLSNMGNYSYDDRYVSSYYLKNSYEISKDNMNEIKSAVIKNGSVSCAFYASESYFNHGAEGYCTYQSDYTNTNHQVVIVGWNDSFAISNFKASSRPDKPGAWLIKNSTAKNLSDGGYCWISYYDTSLSQFAYMDVEKSEMYSNIYQYDGYGYSKSIKSNDAQGNPLSEGSFANVFRAESNEAVNAVSFYTLQTNISYKVQIYTDVTYGQSSPIKDGTLAYTGSGIIENRGYHTVDISEKIPVEKDKYFAVVVTLGVADGTNVSIPFEGVSGESDGSFIRYYASKSGESYYRFAQNSWIESSGNEKYNNVCVKAFTVANDALKINNANDFLNFARSVSNGNSYEGKSVYLESDIDFNSITFETVGNSLNEFNGTFFGNGYVLKNINLTALSDYSGVFSSIGTNGSVKKLGIENMTLNAQSYAGLLCGRNRGKIINCYSTGAINGVGCIGGLIGINAGSVYDSFAGAECTAKERYGSFAGYNSSGFYSHCAVVSQKGMSGVCNLVTDEIIPYTADDVDCGKVEYELDNASSERTYVWTKGKNGLTFAQSNSQAVYKIELYDLTDSSSVYVYAVNGESLSTLAEKANPGYSCTVYSDYKHKKIFDAEINSDKILYPVWVIKNIELKPDSQMIITGDIIKNLPITGDNTAGELRKQFVNESVKFIDVYGNNISDKEYVTNGTKIILVDKDGNTLEEKTFIIYGDIYCDGSIDAYDLSVLFAYLNYSVPSDFFSNAQFKAMDVNHDGNIDSSDAILLDICICTMSGITQNG